VIDPRSVLERDIRDLERIIAADYAVLEMEKSDEKRKALRNEIRELYSKVDTLKSRIDNLSRCD
jgi:hypothetical protein